MKHFVYWIPIYSFIHSSKCDWRLWTQTLIHKEVLIEWALNLKLKRPRFLVKMFLLIYNAVEWSTKLLFQALLCFCDNGLGLSLLRLIENDEKYYIVRVFTRIMGVIQVEPSSEWKASDWREGCFFNSWSGRNVSGFFRYSEIGSNIVGWGGYALSLSLCFVWWRLRSSLKRFPYPSNDSHCRCSLAFSGCSD